MISPFTYATLNFAFVQAVMVSLGSEVEDESALNWGGFWGGVGLGFMLLISHFAINSRMPDILRFDIPMAEIILNFGLSVYCSIQRSCSYDTLTAAEILVVFYVRLSVAHIPGSSN